MPSIEASSNELDVPLHILQREAAEAALSEAPQDAPITTSANIGLIYPPPEVRSILSFPRIYSIFPSNYHISGIK